LRNHGADRAYVYVSERGREYTAAAGAGPPRTLDDHVRIFSVSQTFTAAIVLELAEEGKLHLSDSLAKYVHGVVRLGHRITLLQLLNHTSGLASYTDFGFWLERANRSNTVRPLDLLKVAAFQPRAFKRPGSSFSYSDTGYIALGLVIEKVTGHSYGAELIRRIVRPLRLSGTELASTRHIPGVRDLEVNSPLFPFLRHPGINPNLLWATAGIVSTAHDLGTFFSALLSVRLVSRASLDKMERTVQDPASPVRYGLGLLAFDLSCGSFWGQTSAFLSNSTPGTTVAASPDGSRIAIVLIRGPSVNPDMAALLCS
jgi:D-alanyl-D-alanine carboxypeptidase